MANVLVPSILPGGYTLLAQSSLAGASVTFSNIPQNYRDLYLVTSNYRPTTNDQPLVCRINGVSSTAYRNVATTDAQNTALTFASTFAQLTANNSSSAGNGMSTALFQDYTNSNTWKSVFTTATNNDATTTTSVRHRIGFSIHNGTAAITSLLILSNSGNITSGNVYLYGVE